MIVSIELLPEIRTSASGDLRSEDYFYCLCCK